MVKCQDTNILVAVIDALGLRGSLPTVPGDSEASLGLPEASLLCTIKS